jgi:putative PEP-CTERM system TPR-repeat lipoprotein
VKNFLRLALFACVCLSAGCDLFVSDEERVSRAEKFLAQGEERAAAIELQNVLGSKPNNKSARLLLARVSLRQGDADAAREELGRAVASGASQADTAVLAAEIRLAKGEHAALLEEITAGQSGLDAAHAALYRGLAQAAARDLPAATESFRAALAADPSLSRAQLSLAEARYLAGEGDAAISAIDAVLAEHPDDAQAWALKGRLLAQRGDFASATAALGSARKNAAGQLTPLELNGLLATLVESHLATRDLASARAALADLRERMPNTPLLHLLTARIAMAEQNYPLAVTEAQMTVAAAPEHAMAQLVLGAALLANGNLNQAEARLADLVRQAPDNVEARKLLAEVNLRLQRPDAALQVLASTQQSGASDAQVDAMLAWANLQRGDESAAIELLKRSLAAQPDNERLKLDLALAYVTAGRNQEAIELLDSLPAREGNPRREQLLIAAISASRSPQAAAADVERIVKAHGDDVGVLGVAANYYSRTRDFARARELLGKARALAPKDITPLSSLARVELEAGDDAAASEALQSVLKLDPANRAARMSLAQIALRAADTKAAAGHLEAARKNDARAAEPRLVLATIYLRERRSADADSVLRELEQLASEDTTLTVALGRLYANAGRFDEALNQFRTAARREPANPAWLLEIARVQLARDDRAAARISTEQALALAPDAVDANSLLAGIELREGRKEQALARAQRVRKANPGSAPAALLEGDIQLAMRNAPAAASAFADAYELAPSGPAALRVYQARSINRAADATAVLEDWLKRRPQDVAARLVYAQALLERGRHAPAIAQYEQALQAGRPGAMALNNLAWLYQQAGDSRAEATARQAFDLAPESAAVADTYGWILVEAGRAAEALPILEKAVRAPGAPAEVRYHHAVALAKGGKPAEAGVALRQLLADPRFAQAAEARELLEGLSETGQ